jgi:hypothetical protein
MSDKITEEMMSKLSVDDTNSALLLQNILKLFMTRPKPMTEEEIVQYLKTNRNIGVAFRFMPEEVRRWCNENTFDVEYYSSLDGWKKIHNPELLFTPTDIVCLPEDCEQKKKRLKTGWAEFNIIDGFIEIKNPDKNSIEKFAWYDWQGFLTFCRVYELPYVNFGGFQYALCKTWFMSPQIDNSKGYQNDHNDIVDGECSIPAIPSRVRFWHVVSQTKTQHDDSIDLALNG